MKKSLVIFLLTVCSVIQAQDFPRSVVKMGGGYSKDFPGLRGYALAGEFAYSLSDRLEGSVGMKRLNMNGYPRTASVNEFTKATTLDFNLFFLPFVTESNLFKIGLGYSFSFYKTRRSYPLIETHSAEKEMSWPIQDAKGRTSGIILSGEYEYLFRSNFSLGLKASFCKAYDRVFFIGPFLGLRL